MLTKKRWKNCFLHEIFFYICRICRKKCKTFKCMACFPVSFRLFSSSSVAVVVVVLRSCISSHPTSAPPSIRIDSLTISHSLFRFFYYDIQNRVGARIYNIHIVIIGLDFDMVCAPYTLNNLYLSFEFVVFFVCSFSRGLFHPTFFYRTYMNHDGSWRAKLKRSTLFDARETKKEREENDCECEFVYNTVVHFSRPGCVSFPFCYIHYVGVYVSVR